LSFFLARLASEGHGCADVTGGIIPGTGKDIVVLVSIRGDAGDLIHKMPCSKVNMQRLTGPKRWLRKNFTA
jgi:hypothetical protein